MQKALENIVGKGLNSGKQLFFSPFSKNVFFTKHTVSNSSVESTFIYDLCNMLNSVFNIILIISNTCMLSLCSFNWHSAQYSLSLKSLLSNITIAEKMNSSKRRMTLITITLIYPWKQYWLSQGSNQHRLQILESGQV